MNPRIKELYEQAQDWADNQNFYASEYHDYMMAKFAELIINDCAGWIALGNIPDGAYEASRMLKHYFG